MDRVSFLDAVSGIHYPDMLLTFFDHFITLKELIEDSGKVNVNNSANDMIEFDVEFNSPAKQKMALQQINESGGIVIMYQRVIHINCNVLADTKLKIMLS